MVIQTLFRSISISAFSLFFLVSYFEKGGHHKDLQLLAWPIVLYFYSNNLTRKFDLLVYRHYFIHFSFNEQVGSFTMNRAIK